MYCLLVLTWLVFSVRKEREGSREEEVVFRLNHKKGRKKRGLYSLLPLLALLRYCTALQYKLETRTDGPNKFKLNNWMHCDTIKEHNISGFCCTFKILVFKVILEMLCKEHFKSTKIRNEIVTFSITVMTSKCCIVYLVPTVTL